MGLYVMDFRSIVKDAETSDSSINLYPLYGFARDFYSLLIVAQLMAKKFGTDYFDQLGQSSNEMNQKCMEFVDMLRNIGIILDLHDTEFERLFYVLIESLNECNKFSSELRNFLFGRENADFSLSVSSLAFKFLIEFPHKHDKKNYINSRLVALCNEITKCEDEQFSIRLMLIVYLYSMEYISKFCKIPSEKLVQSLAHYSLCTKMIENLSSTVLKVSLSQDHTILKNVDKFNTYIKNIQDYIQSFESTLEKRMRSEDRDFHAILADLRLEAESLEDSFDTRCISNLSNLVSALYSRSEFIVDTSMKQFEREVEQMKTESKIRIPEDVHEAFQMIDRHLEKRPKSVFEQNLNFQFSDLKQIISQVAKSIKELISSVQSGDAIVLKSLDDIEEVLGDSLAQLKIFMKNSELLNVIVLENEISMSINKLKRFVSRSFLSNFQPSLDLIAALKSKCVPIVTKIKIYVTEVSNLQQAIRENGYEPSKQVNPVDAFTADKLPELCFDIKRKEIEPLAKIDKPDILIFNDLEIRLNQLLLKMCNKEAWGLYLKEFKECVRKLFLYYSRFQQLLSNYANEMHKLLIKTINEQSHLLFEQVAYQIQTFIQGTETHRMDADQVRKQQMARVEEYSKKQLKFWEIKDRTTDYERWYSYCNPAVLEDQKEYASDQGRLKCGTPFGLVQNLINFQSIDQDFSNMFFTVYSMFMNSETLLDLIIQRFDTRLPKSLESNAKLMEYFYVKKIMPIRIK